LGKTCCQETDIYLTMGDIRRIAGYLTRIDFYEYRKPTDLQYLEQEDDPVCRLHPYTCDAGGLAEMLDHRCPLSRPETREELNAALGMTFAQAQAWHLQLYSEIFNHEGIEHHEDRHNLRPAV
jgi:hypothetical protein